MLYLGIFSGVCFSKWLLAMLFPLLLGILIGLLIGWMLWGKYKKMLAEAAQERDEAKAKFEKEHAEVTQLKTDANGLKYQITELERENLSLKNSLNAANEQLKQVNTAGDDKLTNDAPTSYESAETKAEEDMLVVAKGDETIEEAALNEAYSNAFKDTDLRLIEGVDPSIEAILRGAGINTFADLASKKVEELDALFKAAGPEYDGIDSASLIQQGKLANAGRWSDLVLLQKATGEGDVAKVQLYYAAKSSRDTSFDEYSALIGPDNLQIIEGVGPKAEATLRAAGINTISDMASQTPEALKSILVAESVGFRMSKTDTWPKQAELARDGKWKELVEYQKFLDSGRDDIGDFDTPSKVALIVEKLKKGTFATPKRDNTGIDYAAIFGSDNLQIIEGIGPKIESLLKDAGINNWAALGSKKPEEIREVLAAAGNRYKMHNPESWPRQAQLAAEGKWDELITFQKFLDGGRDNAGDFENDSKLEKMSLKILGFSNNPEDLKIIEGIGPKIEGILKDGGINNWSALAATSVDQLKTMLTNAGDRYRLAKPNTWPKQAGLAAEGKWSELKEYQDYLEGGVEPDQA